MAADRPQNGPRLSVGLMAMGSEMAGFTMLGLLIDYGLNTLPWFTVGLTLIGFVFVFYHLIRFAKKLSDRPGPPGGGPG